MNELITVVIPTYSRPDFIIRAIESVMKQTYAPIEIIVVDDNGIGTEYQIKTENLLQPYIKNKSITYLKHKVNKNGSAARNTGFRASNGSYVTFLDDDDEMLPEKLTMQVEVLKNAPSNVAMVYCGCEIMKKDKVLKKIYATKCGNFFSDMLLGRFGFGSGSNLLVRRDAVETVGGYDESFKRHQDTEFTIRLFRYFDIVSVDKTLLIKHNDSKPRRPNSTMYLEIEEHFLKTFKDDIVKMSKNDALNVYYNSYMKMAISAANEPNIYFMLKMIKKANSYKLISVIDILRLIKNLICQPQKR